MEKIILASASRNRQELLRTLGIPYKVVVSDFNERQVKETDPAKRALKIARGKAKKVAGENKGIIIACDTYTVCQGKVMEKPRDLREAGKMIRRLSGNKAVCYTGFCFLDESRRVDFGKTVITRISFRKIYKEEIEEYVKKFPVCSWAAAYALSEFYVFGMIEKISGSFTGLTHGLPCELLIPLLEEAGYKPNPGLV